MQLNVKANLYFDISRVHCSVLSYFEDALFCTIVEHRQILEKLSFTGFKIAIVFKVQIEIGVKL